jgi:hypothetical protein
MTAVYPDRTIVEYHDGTSWVDISRYVVDDIRGDSGFASPSPDDRVATLGTLELTLNNVDKLFTPYGGDAARGLSTLTGWKKGAKVRVRVEIKQKSYDVWVGRVADIKSDAGVWGNRRAHVVLVDWMDVSSRFPMKGSEILTNQAIDDAATSLLARLSIQPEDTDFDEGNETLPAVFSNVKEKTKAISELNKLAMSELGYAYVLKDGTLRIENSSARKGTRGLDKVNIHPDLMDTLELVDGDSFELTNGELLLLEEAEEARLTYTAEKLDMETDNEQTINSVYVRAYPVQTDTSLVTVFSLGSPIVIGGGRSVPFSARYTDPNGGSPISATNLQTPVATTDYLMNSASDGSGTNLTANLTVTATYYGDQVDYILTNTGTTPGYIIKLQARGYGIYFDSPIEVSVSDQDSIDAHGDFAITLDQRYKRDLSSGVAYAESILELMKDPKSRVVSARFLANLSHSHMMASLNLDVGSLISIHENRSEMTKWYYIFSRAFVITLGGILIFTFGCVEAPNIENGGLNPVSVDFGGPGTQDAIDFGYLPQVYSSETPDTLSISARIYADALPSVDSHNIFGFVTNAGGFRVYLDPTAGAVGVYSNIFNVSPGIWETVSTPVTSGSWHHIVVTYDISSTENNPAIYVDGVSRGIIEIGTPAGSAFARNGATIMIGNIKTITEDYNRPFDGQIKDVRVYHHILTSEEVVELYNGGTQDYSQVTDGMVFQGIAINSDLGDASSLDGQEIPSGNKYFDNVNRYVGEPNGSPLIRE